MPTKINHVAIVVDELTAATRFWRDALGLPLGGVERVEAEAVEVAFLSAGESKIELVQPLTSDSGIARYLAKRGPGLHHICLEVDALDQALDQLRDHGVDLINDIAQTHADGRRYAFIHPRSTGGVLVELYETRSRAS